MPEQMSRDITEDRGIDTVPENSMNRDGSYADPGTNELHTADLVGGTRSDEGERRQPEATPLLGDTEDYRRRWEAVQTGFVDEPRRAVENADALVAEIIQELAKSFAQERNGLESQWSQGDQVSTEDLRVSLQRYRSFFDRLLTT